MARRMPRRYKSGPKRGQFMSKAARKRKRNPPRKRARAATSTRRRAPAKRKRNIGRTVARRANPVRKKRRSYARNPRRPNIIRTLTDGLVEAGQILVGKAAVRTLPDLAGLPKQGNMGIAIQAGAALVIGFVADMFLGRNAVRAITAGALTAPLETLIVAYQIPWLSGALAPVTANGALGAYVQRGGGGPGRVAAATAPGMGRYVRAPRVSRVSTARGMGNGGYN